MIRRRTASVSSGVRFREAFLLTHDGGRAHSRFEFHADMTTASPIPNSSMFSSRFFKLAFAVLVSTPLVLQADDWPHWRGPNHDGHSAETGLLKSWPDEGPALKWMTKGLGGGYSGTVRMRRRRIRAACFPWAGTQGAR